MIAAYLDRKPEFLRAKDAKKCFNSYLFQIQNSILARKHQFNESTR